MSPRRDAARPPAEQPAPPPRAAALLGALFNGLSDEDRAWVVERIRHYRALAAANEVSEGRT